MRLLFITILQLSLTFAIAQEKKVRFSTINSAGVMKGKNGTMLQVQSVNGVRFKTNFIGLGAGIDWYYFRTVPLFLSLRKNILDQRNTPFAYLDMGANLYWDDKYEDFMPVDGPRYKYYPGIYYDAGIGYSASEGGKLAAFFSLGFSQKNIKEKEKLFWGGPDPSYMITKYMLRRLSLKAGLSF